MPQKVLVIPPMAQPDVMIVGDVMLDRYWHATVNRVNPEAPGVVCNVSYTQSSLGGCGAVATLCHGLDLTCSLACAVGPDRDGDEVASLVHAVVDGGCVLALTQPCTTVKQRVIANGTLMHTRFDFEERCELDQRISRQIDRLVDTPAIVISDYGKGFVSDALIRRVVRRARKAGSFIMVDPAAGRPITAYRGAAVIKMNAREARLATELDPASAAEFISHIMECAVIVTDGADGMFFHQGKQHFHQPAVSAKVVDVSGAGDTVMAALALGCVRGLGWRPTLAMAAELAAKQIGQHGVCAVKEAQDARGI